MEKDINQNIVENLTMVFDEAIDTGNIEQARKAIAEIKDLDVLQAKVLENELLNLPVSHFN